MSSENHDLPVGWPMVEQACLALVARLGEIAADVTAEIRVTVPAYAAIPLTEHRAAVEEQLQHRLVALAQGRALSKPDLAAATDLAVLRAKQGIPIDALIAAYQAGDHAIWLLLAKQPVPELVPLMPMVGSMIFDATSVTTTVMAQAHSRVARVIDGGRITLAHQLMESLDDIDARPAAALVASRLGLDPAGSFVGMVWQPLNGELGEAHEAVSLLQSEAVDMIGRVAGGALELLAQASEDVEDVRRRVAQRTPGGRWGIGLVRAGLEGAATSLADARIALSGATMQRPVCWFEDHWLESVVLSESRRIAPLLDKAIDTARAHPHLAETVLAFAAADMSIAKTAQAIHLHANSVTYRLDRWSRIAGLDARTFEGLSASVVACGLVGDQP